MGIYFMIHSIVVVLLIFFKHFSFAVVDSIGQSQSLSDGKTLVSPEGTFEFGFFSPGDSKSRYAGIWYAKIPFKTVIWVANRCNPINDSSGLITINSTGNLVLLNRITNEVIWSSKSSSQRALKPLKLQLLESGNLVLRDEKIFDSEEDDYLWQSFDFPSDTLLPGMKFGWDLKKGINRKISSWKNWDDPCPADFESRFEVSLENMYPESYIWKNGAKYYRSAPWNGLGTSGIPANINENQLFNLDFVANKDESYYVFTLKNDSVITIVVMNGTTSTSQRLRWIVGERIWSLYSSEPQDYCDNYGLCGGNSICTTTEAQLCKCLDGFEPKSPEKWDLTDWSGGCIRKTPLKCDEKYKDGFDKFAGFKIPDTANSWGNWSMDLKECREKCLNNCSCVAFANSDIRGKGSGCIIWFGDLIDIRKFPSATSQDFYIRTPASELSKANGKIRAAIVVAVVGVIFGMLLFGLYIYKRTSGGRSTKRRKNNNNNEEENSELPSFSLSIIKLATSNFSLTKKLGQGGYGPVYKGKLENGQEIAVKRLCLNSSQGLDEFKNEVIIIAKLQHRNLVKLLGCCIEEEEKLLVYEYMPNKSLDSFIFDEVRRKLIKWPRRFEIICGIARGILYLHQDSRLRIIHRDLKASNVLLDKDMNPKISDFGLARTFGGDQIEGNTNRVVGTLGYMAPEYAFSGSFSTKSDVYSFGIMVLEIISGKRSTRFRPQEDGNTLTGEAWSYMKGGRAFELVDTCLRDSIDNIDEVLRCIHIGVLCVQQRASDRPKMSSVVVMLGSESSLPEPKRPGFYMETDFVGEAFSIRPGSSSTNKITFSSFDA